MANTFCSLNIHCIFSTEERVPMLNPELRERLWPFLGGIAKQNGITPRCMTTNISGTDKNGAKIRRI